MKKAIMVIMFCLPCWTSAQKNIVNKGIQFEQGLTWKQILAKAKAEKKYIFVDYYATWCGPCRRMDGNVYTDNKVGDFVNREFISIKVQGDTSAHDNEQIKSWYTDANNMKRQYNIGALPSFLFFASDGNIVHKDMGFKNVDEFIALARRASNPNEQYYTLLENYKRGIKDYRVLPYLISTALSLQEIDMAGRMQVDYLHNYLYKLDEDELYTKENIKFLLSAVESSHEKGFLIFYRHPDKVDEVMNQKGLSKRFVDFIITKEEIYPRLFKDKKPITDSPQWSQIIRKISRKYNKSYADRTVLSEQISWYNHRKDWPNLIRCEVLNVDKYGLDTAGFWGKFSLNNMIYDVIFKHCDDTVTLNKAIRWMEVILYDEHNHDDAEYGDTYANLLYKVGRTQEALKWEERAAAKGDKEIQNTYEMMRRGDKTWQ